MNENSFLQLSGALYYPPKRSDFWEKISSYPDAHEFEKLSPGWIRFVVSPRVAWNENIEVDEKVGREREKGPSYQFYVRRGKKGRILLVSTKSDWITKLLNEIGCDSWINSTPTVDIPKLMNDLVARPRKIQEYSVGAVYAKVHGYGQSLRTIILYGDDVASASLFEKDILPKAKPYRLALRKNKWRQVISIGDKADVAFPYRDTNSLKDVDDVIKVIGIERGHLDWETESYE